MKYVFGITVAILVSALIVGNVQQSEARASIWKGVACAKDYMVNLVRDKVLSKSTLVRHYNEAMNTVKIRFEEAKLNGELDNKDDTERENFFYKLVVEELRNLKSHIESGEIKEENVGADSETNRSLSTCVDPDAMVENWNPDSESMDEDAEMQLLFELEGLEQQARNQEDEMGLALTEEARAALKSRTKQVLMDLINNELRQIGLAVLSAYLSGGSIMPAFLSLAGPIKYKLADFFMSTVVDLVSYAMGRKVELSPALSQAAAAA